MHRKHAEIIFFTRVPNMSFLPGCLFFPLCQPSKASSKAPAMSLRSPIFGMVPHFLLFATLIYDEHVDLLLFRGCLGLAFMWPGNQTRPLERKPELLQLQRPGHVKDGTLQGHRSRRIPFPQITSWSGKRPVLLPSYAFPPSQVLLLPLYPGKVYQATSASPCPRFLASHSVLKSMTIPHHVPARKSLVLFDLSPGINLFSLAVPSEGY